jgi:hypothetical protein
MKSGTRYDEPVNYFDSGQKITSPFSSPAGGSLSAYFVRIGQIAKQTAPPTKAAQRTDGRYRGLEKPASSCGK